MQFFKKKLIFEAKIGVFGQYGWHKISFSQYLFCWLDNRVRRIRWTKKL